MFPKAHVLYRQIQAKLVEAVRCYKTGDDAREALCATDLPAQTEEFAHENLLLLESFLQNPKGAAAAVLNHPESLHYARFLRLPRRATDAVAQAVSNAQARKHWPLSGIWKHYADAALFSMGYGPSIVFNASAKGAEKRYVPLILLMCATTDEQKDLFRGEAIRAFEAANRDKRVIDWIGLDGDGSKPANWNFRLYAIECGT